jgi:hypothetical protein
LHKIEISALITHLLSQSLTYTTNHHILLMNKIVINTFTSSLCERELSRRSPNIQYLSRLKLNSLFICEAIICLQLVGESSNLLSEVYWFKAVINLFGQKNLRLFLSLFFLRFLTLNKLSNIHPGSYRISSDVQLCGGCLSRDTGVVKF